MATEQHDQEANVRRVCCGNCHGTGQVAIYGPPNTMAGSGLCDVCAASGWLLLDDEDAVFADRVESQIDALRKTAGP